MLSSLLNNRNVYIICGAICALGIALICLVNSIFDKVILDADKDWDKAIKISEENAEEFPYSVKTQQGGIYAEGPIIAVSPRVTDERLQGDYLAIAETFEEYRMHTETYSCNCRTVNGTTTCSTCTRNYWSWDYAGEDIKKVDTISLLGQEMNSNFIPWANGFVGTKLANGDIHYYYNGSRRSSFSVLSEKSGGWGFVSDKDGFRYDSNLNGPISGFWNIVRWITLIILFLLTGGLAWWFWYENYESVDKYI